MAQIYAAPYNNVSNASASATSGLARKYFGLVVGFQQ